ncbi:MAG TPA: AI-2E family transporter [Acetobacteraceae bacterium]
MLLGGLAVGCLLVLYPFFSALLWAAILAFTTWPVFEWLHVRLRLRRSAAALLMVLLTAIVLVLPLGLAAPESAGDVMHLRHSIEVALHEGLPASPVWLHGFPIIGPSLAELWDRWAADLSEAVSALRPYLGIVLEGLLHLLLGIASGVLMFVLALFIAFFFYLYGEPIAERMRTILLRIAGPRGDRVLTMIGLTVRGVVFGLLGTAILQGVLVGIGLELAGVPRPVLLGALAGFISVFPVGAPVVWVPATLWLISTDHLGHGVFLAAWGLICVSGLDSIVRPWLISRGSELPFLLTVLGVLGGAVAFGLLGIFLGPVLLGVGYTLANEWAGEPLPVLTRKDAPGMKTPGINTKQHRV